MARLSLTNIHKDLPDSKALFDDLCMNVKEGEFVVVFGESGCGKTTLLRMIAGLDQQYSGSLLFDNKEMNGVPAEQRGVGLMSQSASLFPHMTVTDNVLFPLKVAGISKAEQQVQLEHIASVVGINDFLNRYPKQLSGGQQQRVALARCLIQKPRIFLLDEPLSNLDRAAKVNLRMQIQKIQRELGITTLFVTHDQEEAMQLADRIVVLGRVNHHSSGENTDTGTDSLDNDNTSTLTQILQIDSPETLFFTPKHLHVAQMFGNPMINLINAVVEESQGGHQRVVLSSPIVENEAHIGENQNDKHDGGHEEIKAGENFEWMGIAATAKVVEPKVILGIRAEGIKLLKKVEPVLESVLKSDIKRNLLGDIAQLEMINGEYLCYFNFAQINGNTVRLVAKWPNSSQSADSIQGKMPQIGERWQFDFVNTPLLVFKQSGHLIGKIKLSAQ